MRRAWRRHVGDDLAVLHADVAHLAGDAVGGVVHAAAGDPEHHRRPPIAASTSSTLGRSAASGARSGTGTPSMRCDGTRHLDAVGRGGERDPRGLRRRRGARVDDHDRQPAQALGSSLERVGGHHERGVDVAALEQRRRAPGLLARVTAREAHRRGEAGLPGEHVLGAARVAVAAQPQRDRVAVAAEVAHERGQRQRGELVERAVDEGDVARAEQALGEPSSASGPGRRVRGADSAQRPQRLEVAPSSSMNAPACSAVAVRVASTTTSASRCRGAAAPAGAGG